MSNAFSSADQLVSPHSHTPKHAALSCFLLVVVTCTARASPWPCFVELTRQNFKTSSYSLISLRPPSTMFAFLHLHFSFSCHMKAISSEVQSCHVHWCFIAVVSGYMWTHVNPCVLFCSQEANTNTENTDMPPYSPAPKAHTPRVKKMKVRLIVCVCIRRECMPVYATWVSVGMFP